MKQPRAFIFLANFCLVHALTPPWTRPHLAAAAETHVNLLGQPCLLSGPYEDTLLKLIHSLGPAQIYPNLSHLEQPNTQDQINKALTKIQNAKPLPNLLDRYRERLIRRLQQQLRFIQALHNQTPTDSLLKLGKEMIREPELKKFDALVKRRSSQKEKSPDDPSVTEQLFEIFNESIEADPESEFHRAIKKLQIQYNCSFEESDPPTDDPKTQSH